MNSVRKSLVTIVSAVVALCVTSTILVAVPRLAAAGTAIPAAAVPVAAIHAAPDRAG